MEFSSPSLKSFLYFMKEFECLKNKQTKSCSNPAYDVFSIFTTVKHREVPCEPKLMQQNRNKLLEHFTHKFGILNNIFV